MQLKNPGHRSSLLALQIPLRLLCLIAVLGSMIGLSSTAAACPMCKIAHEDALDPAVAARPKAYMYSILFMLAMPAGLATTFGVTFYRLSKKQQELNEQWFREQGLGEQRLGEQQLSEQWPDEKSLDQHHSDGSRGSSSEA